MAAVSGRQDLAPLMARAVIRPLALVSGELYTAKDAQGELVGFTIWAPPGRSAFDTYVVAARARGRWLTDDPGMQA